MSTALIGLGGVVLGVVATLLSPALAERRQVRNEAKRWRRDQLASAYQQALRYLLRASNRRSEFEGGRGGAVLRRQHQREWFDDLVEAQVWLRMVTRYCDVAQLETISHVANQLDSHVNHLVSGQRFDQKDFSIWRVLRTFITTVTECARVDGGSVFVRSDGREAEVIAVPVSDGADQADAVAVTGLPVPDRARREQPGEPASDSERNVELNDEEPDQVCRVCGGRCPPGFHDNIAMTSE